MLEPFLRTTFQHTGDQEPLDASHTNNAAGLVCKDLRSSSNSSTARLIDQMSADDKSMNVQVY